MLSSLLKAYSISEVVYDWARLKRPTKKPHDLPTLMIENHSRSRQVITRTLTEENTETDTFTMTNAKSFDISLEGEKGNGEEDDKGVTVKVETVNIQGDFSSSHGWTKGSTEATTNAVSS